MALELNASKHRIYEYVESRMSFIAPNLSIIIGASTAAKIMGEVPAGSLLLGAANPPICYALPPGSSCSRVPSFIAERCLKREYGKNHHLCSLSFSLESLRPGC